MPPAPCVPAIDEGREGRHADDLPCLVVLPAQWLRARAFDAFAERMATRARIVRLDLPGHGDSPPMVDGDYSAHGYAAAIEHALDAMAITRCVLLGQSHSGLPAALLASRAPERITGLVLATSSGLRAKGHTPPRVPLDPAERTQAWYRERLTSLLRRDHSPARLDALARQVHADNESPQRIEEARSRARAFDPALMPALLPRLRVPGLILWSSDSSYLPSRLAKRFAAAWPACSSPVILPKTGHLLLLDAPDACAEHVLSFLETLA